MRILVDLPELEALSRLYERNTTELAGITIDLRRRLSDDLLRRVAAYGLATGEVAADAERVAEALVVHVAELERFTMDLERVWAEARGLAQDGRLAPGISGTQPDLWWFRNAAAPGAGHATDSLAFAAAAAAPAGHAAAVSTGFVDQTAVVGIAGGSAAGGAGGTIAAVINIATAEVGYVESGGADGNSGNITKYWAELHPSFQGAPWCAAFVSWVFLHAGFPLPPMEQPYGFAYVPSAYTHYRSLGRFFPDPSPGDVVIFNDQAHTGIAVSGLDGAGKFHTVEGNTSPGSSGSQSNGGGVYAKIRDLSQVMGFCRPDYDSARHAGKT